MEATASLDSKMRNKVVKFAGSGGIEIEYDKELTIATARSRKAKRWKNRNTTWKELLSRLSENTITDETHEEYLQIKADDKANKTDHAGDIKDIGGFVGGKLRSDGRRTMVNIESRSALTIDLDKNVPADIWEKLEGIPLMDRARCIYTSHSHAPETPRLRLIIPLERDVSPDEYDAISRMVSEWIGIECVDKASHRANQFMYWPSTSRDIAPVFQYKDAPILNPDDVLSEYDDMGLDWHNHDDRPRSAEEARPTGAGRWSRQQDPREKSGIVGAFCRAYSITEAIEEFLPGVYAPTNDRNRWTYTAGSSAAGLVIYDDESLCKSHHATDPANNGHELNAFDLVRVHKFGSKDKGTDEANTEKLPSYTAMCAFAVEVPVVKDQLNADRMEEAAEDFAESEEDPKNWLELLELEKKTGQVKKTLRNLETILRYDPELKGIVFNQLTDSIEVTGRVHWNREGLSDVWRDQDDQQLISYVSNHYREFSRQQFETAISVITDNRRYHPIRRYFEQLPEWDGVQRVDSLLIDYLGAEDHPYTRAVTRKALCAAHNRVFNPGCKFDYMVVLNGDQGIGKSTLIAKLGMGWYSSSLKVSDMSSKAAAEKLQGAWILEVAELAGMRKADIEVVKGFITEQDDRYRASFGRRVTRHPRQCVFFGTTNSTDGYLRDPTGGRRFWPVKVSTDRTRSPFDLDQQTVNQIWAEVKVLAERGEKLFLTPELEEFAKGLQREAMEVDERDVLVQAYLDTLVPADWDSWTISDRRAFFEGDKTFMSAENAGKEPVMLRDKISNAEIWAECLGNDYKKLDSTESRRIGAIMAKIPGWRRTDKRSKRHPEYDQQRLYIRDKRG